MKINRVVGGFLWVGVIATALYVVPRWMAPSKPPAFEQGFTLVAAQTAANENKKPVLIFATASWCPPCQEMKRSTLRETRVERMLQSDFNSVYLDVDQNTGDGAQLKVFSLPTTIVMVGDQELARVEGGMDSASYLSWLEAAWAQAKTGVIPPRSRELQPGDTPRVPPAAPSTDSVNK
jgi:thiol:disulfide interchange protein